MLFNSLDFLVFLPFVFVTYWFVTDKTLRLQNFFVLIASYIFYSWWDWRFLSLIILSTLVDYSIGRKLGVEDDDRKRKYLLWISVAVNLGILGFFKYFNFFLESFIEAFSFFGYSIQTNTLNIVLPVGVSFYTFQTMSYTIDVYRRKLEPTQDIVAFGAFVSFFPQLVAGPIERATNLLPQFYKKRIFTYKQGVDGMRLILWGLFKKVVIADNCAEYANLIFNNYDDFNGVMLILGAIFFTFQIYGDFSGYSDIAIGTSKLFGFNLMQNFATPYFSRDIAEFWRRWHISLSTWFRDYLYIPLGGSRGSKWHQVRNVFIIFIVSGFWHGANWTFIIWGGLNAIYFLPLLLLKMNRTHVTSVVAERRELPTIKEFFQILFTFIQTVFAWVLFRSKSVDDGVNYLLGMFNFANINEQKYYFTQLQVFNLFVLIGLLIIFIYSEWITRGYSNPFESLNHLKNKTLERIIYLLFVLSILVFGVFFERSQFIYFQF